MTDTKTKLVESLTEMVEQRLQTEVIKQDILQKTIEFLSLYVYYNEMQGYANYSPDTVWQWLETAGYDLLRALDAQGIEVPKYELEPELQETLDFWETRHDDKK